MHKLQQKEQKQKQKKEKRMKPELIKTEPIPKHNTCEYTERNCDHCFTIHSTTTGNKSEIWSKQFLQILNFWHWNKHYNLLSSACQTSYWPDCYQFSTCNLSVHDIYHFASKVNKLNILKVNGERKLHKDDKEVIRPPLKEAMSQLLAFSHSQWK